MKTYVILFVFIISSYCFSQQIDFSKIEGWKPVSEVNVYDPDNLWEYNNGAADQFISYGFQLMHNCDLESGDLQVTIDIFDMGSRLNAFGIYTAQKPGSYEKISVGVESVLSPPAQCLLLKDRYYVVVNVFEGKIEEDTGRSLLESIAQILSGTDEYPEEIKLLPTHGIVASSEKFTRESYQGLADLNNCVSARYNSNQAEEFEYFKIIYMTNETNDSIWKKLEAKWETANFKDHPILFRKIPYKGIVGVILTDKGIFGVTNSNDQQELFQKLDLFIK